MSFHKIPPFDLLVNQEIPFTGFGDILEKSTENEKTLISLAKQAQIKIEEIFEVNFLIEGDNSMVLEAIIDKMWKDGWDPSKADINLFIRDFGLVLAKTILDLYGGEPIFRSGEILDHFSVWWPDKQLETFPFHKVQKRLFQKSGESLSFFIKGLSTQLTN